jgi:hypothetical protein
MISKVECLYLYIYIFFFKCDIVPSAISFSEKKFHPPGPSKESEGEGATPGGLVLLEKNIVEIPGYHKFFLIHLEIQSAKPFLEIARNDENVR